MANVIIFFSTPSNKQAHYKSLSIKKSPHLQLADSPIRPFSIIADCKLKIFLSLPL